MVPEPKDIYVNPDSDEIKLFTITSNGNITSGVITIEEDKLVVRGTLKLIDRKLENKKICKFSPDGTISAKFFRIENGEWKAGYARLWMKYL